MANAVVTGAAGFLGSFLVDALLARGNEVTGLDNLATGRAANLAAARGSPKFRFRRVDVARASRFPRADVYYHLASPASPVAYQQDPVGTLLANSAGTHRVLQAARRADARVLIASTSEVYGDPDVHPQTEAYWGHVDPIGPRSCYDEGKRYSEALGMAYRRRYGLDVRIARIFNTYGPRMRADDGRVIPNFIVQGMRRRPLTIYGKGTQTRSFCYVSDLVRGLQLTMQAAPSVPVPINLGNPQEVSIHRLAAIISEVLGVPLRVHSEPLPESDPRQRCPDIARARKHLGWEPRVTFEVGIRKTVEYFRGLHRA